MAQLFWLTIFLICNLLAVQWASADPWSGRRLYAGDAYVNGDFSASKFFGEVSSATVADASNQIPQDDLEYILSELWYKTGIAYNQRYRWDGGAAGLDAVLGRQSLGLGSAATRAAADTVGNDEALPDGAAVINYINGRGFISNPNDSVDASELEVLFGPLGAGLMVRSASGVFLITPDNHKGWDTAYNNIIQYASNWQTAYSERYRWDGGAAGLDAVLGRQSLQLDTYYSGIGHNHGTGTVGKIPKFTGASTFGNSIIQDYSTYALVRGSLAVENGLGGIISNESLLNNFISGEGDTGNNLILYSAKNRLALAHKKYSVSTNQTINIDNAFLPGDTWVNITSDKLPLTIEILGTFDNFSRPAAYRPFVFMHRGYFGSIKFEIRGANGTWYVVDDISNNASVWWVGSTNSIPSFPFTGVRFTFNNASGSPVYLRELGFFHPRSEPWTQYIMAQGDTIYGSLNFSGVDSDIITPAGEHFSIMPGTGGRVGIKTTNPLADLDVNGSARIVASSLSTQPSHVATQTGSDNVLKWQTWGDFINNLVLSGKIGGGNIGGTGSAGYVAKFIASATLANSQIQDDGTNVAVGKTPDTSVKFDVAGNIRAQDDLAASTLSVGNVAKANVSSATITDASNQIPQDDLEYILSELWYRMGIAYSQRYRWDGGSAGLDAATGRASLQLDTYYSGINHNHGTGTTNYFPVYSNGASGTIKNSSFAIGTYVTGDTYMDFGFNAVRNLLIPAQGNTGVYLAGQHNILYNADKRAGYSVSQSGDIVFSPTSALFDGSEMVYLVSGDIQPSTPTVITVLFPALHSQTNYWYFGWTSRYYYPNQFKFEARNRTTQEWFTLANVSNWNQRTYFDVYYNNVYVDGMRLTIYDTISSDGLQIGEIYFGTAEAYDPYNGLYLKNAGDTAYGTITFKGVTTDIATNTGEHLAIIPGSGGNVGIKTTNPAYDLDVNGNARANKIYFPDAYGDKLLLKSSLYRVNVDVNEFNLFSDRYFTMSSDTNQDAFVFDADTGNLTIKGKYTGEGSGLTYVNADTLGGYSSNDFVKRIGDSMYGDLTMSYAKIIFDASPDHKIKFGNDYNIELAPYTLSFQSDRDFLFKNNEGFSLLKLDGANNKAIVYSDLDLQANNLTQANKIRMNSLVFETARTEATEGALLAALETGEVVLWYPDGKPLALAVKYGDNDLRWQELITMKEAENWPNDKYALAIEYNGEVYLAQVHRGY